MEYAESYQNSHKVSIMTCVEVNIPSFKHVLHLNHHYVDKILASTCLHQVPLILEEAEYQVWSVQKTTISLLHGASFTCITSVIKPYLRKPINNFTQIQWKSGVIGLWKYNYMKIKIVVPKMSDNIHCKLHHMHWGQRSWLVYLCMT